MGNSGFEGCAMCAACAADCSGGGVLFVGAVCGTILKLCDYSVAELCMCKWNKLCTWGCWNAILLQGLISEATSPAVLLHCCTAA